MKQDVLKIKIIPVNDKYSVGYIEYQNTDVLKRWEFVDYEIGVCSSYTPKWNKYPNTLCVWGIAEERDLLPLIIPNEDVELIENKVKAINEKYGTRWRAEKEKKYYFVNPQGDVEFNEDLYDTVDDGYYNSHNYFQTKEEAEEMAEKWRKLFKGEEM